MPGRIPAARAGGASLAAMAPPTRRLPADFDAADCDRSARTAQDPGDHGRGASARRLGSSRKTCRFDLAFRPTLRSWSQAIGKYFEQRPYQTTSRFSNLAVAKGKLSSRVYPNAAPPITALAVRPVSLRIGQRRKGAADCPLASIDDLSHQETIGHRYRIPALSASPMRSRLITNRDAKGLFHESSQTRLLPRACGVRCDSLSQGGQ
jgi:hypothetical protein